MFVAWRYRRVIFSVLADDVGDPLEIVDAGLGPSCGPLMGIVLSPGQFDDDLKGLEGWMTVNCCPN